MFLGSLTHYPELVFGFSGAADGTMSLNGGMKNRRIYLERHGLSPDKVVHAGLCHGTRIAVVSGQNGGQIIDDTDGLITIEPNLGLAMTAADCLLVYVYDPQERAIGLAHAGRRGLADQILTALIEAFRRDVTSQPERLMVGIGPSICPLHYAVRPEEAAPFDRWPEAGRRVGDYVQLDLRQVARRQLTAAGVSLPNISLDGRCTFEEPTLFSYRRNHPVTGQLQVGYLSRRS